MSDTINKRSRISIYLAFIVAFICLLLGAGLIGYKHYQLELPLLPRSTVNTWIIDVKISLKSKRPVNAELMVPPPAIASKFESENFISDGFAVAIFVEESYRKIVWSGMPRKSEHVLNYRVVYRPGSELTYTEEKLPKLVTPSFNEEEVKALRELQKELRAAKLATTEEKALFILRALLDRSSDRDSDLMPPGLHSTFRRIKQAEEVLAHFGIHARRIQGFVLQGTTRDAALKSWLQVYDGEKWRNFSQIALDWKEYNQRIPWRYGYGELLELKGASESDLVITILPGDEASTIGKLDAIQESIYPMLTDVSSELQAVFRLILLIPLGALFIVFLRCVIGLTTFGTFMPVLIALALRETTLVTGIIYFGAILTLGIVVRLILNRMRLLMVPRLSAILTCIIGLIVSVAYCLEIWGEINGSTVALFPIIVLTMTIERMSVILDERGLFEASVQAAWSILAAVLCYLLIFNPTIEYLVLVFPEFLFVVLGLNILLGRYTGYRLFELYRFRNLILRG